MPAALAALDLSLRRHAPALHAHLAGCGFDPQLYAVEWLSALFVVSVPRTLSLAVLDLLFAGVEDAPQSCRIVHETTALGSNHACEAAYFVDEGSESNDDDAPAYVVDEGSDTE